MVVVRTLGTLFVACTLIHNAWAGDVHSPEVPKMMRAAAIDHAGDSSALTLHTLPVPKPDANEILKMLDQKPGTSVVIDCENTDFFSSSTLGFFMKL